MINDFDKILSLTISTLGFTILLFGYYAENIIYIRLFLLTGSLILMMWGLICFDIISGLSIYLFNFIYAYINLYRLIKIYYREQHYTQIH